MDSQEISAATVRGESARRALNGKDAAPAAADVSGAVDEVLRGLDRLERVAGAQGADVRSLGLVRCARDAILAARDRHRRGAFKTEAKRRPR